MYSLQLGVSGKRQPALRSDDVLPKVCCTSSDSIQIGKTTSFVEESWHISAQCNVYNRKHLGIFFFTNVAHYVDKTTGN